MNGIELAQIVIVRQDELKYIPELSIYNNNYYKADFIPKGIIVFAQSDDDNETDYFFVYNNRYYSFGYSRSSKGDIIEYWALNENQLKNMFEIEG